MKFAYIYFAVMLIVIDYALSFYFEFHFNDPICQKTFTMLNLDNQ